MTTLRYNGESRAGAHLSVSTARELALPYAGPLRYYSTAICNILYTDGNRRVTSVQHGGRCDHTAPATVASDSYWRVIRGFTDWDFRKLMQKGPGGFA
eukprot:scaffold295245_cov48-Prasinocladus_malaysianus.AAC.2